MARSGCAPSVVREIVAAEMTSSDPEAMARRWGQVLERPIVATGKGGWEIALDRGRLLFVPVAAGEPEGVAAFHFECAEPRRALEAAAERALGTDGNRARVGGVDLVFTAAGAAG